MDKIFVEICTLPFITRYEDAQNVYYELIMCQNKQKFDGDDKTLAYIASRKWIGTYEMAIKVYNRWGSIFQEDDYAEYFKYMKPVSRLNKYFRKTGRHSQRFRDHVHQGVKSRSK